MSIYFYGGCGNSIKCSGYVYRESFGEEGKNSLVLLTQSDGSSVIEEMLRKKIIDDWKSILLLDDIDNSEIDHTEYGARVKKAIYLTEQEYESQLKML